MSRRVEFVITIEIEKSDALASEEILNEMEEVVAKRGYSIYDQAHYELDTEDSEDGAN